MGRQSLSGAIGTLQAQMPGHILTRTSALDPHHDLVRFSWTVIAPDGTVAVAGTDVLVLDGDGRVRISIAFFGDLVEP